MGDNMLAEAVGKICLALWNEVYKVEDAHPQPEEPEAMRVHACGKLCPTPLASPPPAHSLQTTFLAFCVGTLFLSQDKGFVNNSVSDSLAAANNMLGVLFFTCMSL
jgi:hypothetical protein